jgi:hypothetical protein
VEDVNNIVIGVTNELKVANNIITNAVDDVAKSSGVALVIVNTQKFRKHESVF